METAYRFAKESIVVSLLVALLAVNLVIVLSPASREAAHALAEAGARRSAVEEYISWHEFRIGPLNALAMLLLPIWVALGLFFATSDLAEGRKAGTASLAILWLCFFIMTFGGVALFIATCEKNPESLWGYNPLRIIPLTLCGVPGGALSGLLGRDGRWPTLAIGMIAFFVVFIYISGSYLSHV